jgi:hypothetical protein
MDINIIVNEYYRMKIEAIIVTIKKSVHSIEITINFPYIPNNRLFDLSHTTTLLVYNGMVIEQARK